MQSQGREGEEEERVHDQPKDCDGAGEVSTVRIACVSSPVVISSYQYYACSHYNIKNRISSSLPSPSYARKRAGGSRGSCRI